MKLASHEQAQTQLVKAWKKGVFPQSLLIEGQAGIGKKQFAVQWARLLSCHHLKEQDTNSESSGLELCGECYACRSFDPQKGHTHIHFVPPILLPTEVAKSKKKSSEALAQRITDIIQKPFHLNVIQSNDVIKIDQIREIHEIASFKRSETHVVIIPEAQKMRVDAANALLKVLEEVPPNMYFLLTCSNRSGLLQTILSRCSRIHLPPNTMNEIIEVMGDHETNLYPPQVLASLSGNSIGKCMELIESGEIDARQKALTFLAHIASETSSRFLLWMKKSGEMEFTRAEALDFMNSLELIWSDFLSLKKGTPIRNIDLEAQLMNHPLNQQDISFFFDQFELLAQSRAKIGSNAHVFNILVSLGLQFKGAFHQEAIR